jgi:hypothetical protein
MQMSARASTFAISLLMMSCTGLVDLSDPAREDSEGSSRGDGDGDGDGSNEESSSDGNDGSGDDGSDSGDDSSSDDSSSDDWSNDDSSSDDSSSDDSSSDDSDDSSGGDDFDDVDDSTLDWQSANLTNFESYPEEGSSECIDFNGCEWAGYFAGLDGKQSYEWVRDNNIAAVRSDHFDQYSHKTLRLRDGDRTIDVKVYDLCSDNDCSGCCSQNSSETGFLIDLEIHTADRFGTHHGIVEWACLDC